MPQSTLKAWLSKPTSMPMPTRVEDRQENNLVEESLSSAPNSHANDERPSETKTANGTANSPGTPNATGLPPHVEIRACIKEDIPALKRLTGLLLPIQYPDSFYKDIIDDPVTNSITLLALWHSTPSTNPKDQQKPILIGAIRCRLLAHPPPTTTTSPESKLAQSKEGPTLYLSTLVLLSPYRGHGIATHMLNLLTQRAVHAYGISSVGAHVWEANGEGLEWYRKRGFSVVGREEGYYRRLKPGTAVVVERRVGVLDLAGG